MWNRLTRLFAGKIKLTPAPQTAAPAFARLRQERDPHPSRGLTPVTLAALLDAAERGDLAAQAALAEDMQEKDAHLHAELSKRKRALLTLDWDVFPSPNGGARAKRQAAEVRDWLSRLTDFEDLLLNLADGLLYGYACIELEWARIGGLWFPTFHRRPPSWFVPDADRITLLLRTDGRQGEPLQPFGWICHRHAAKSGYLARSGLVRVLAWPYLFKNYAVRDLSALLELHGIPLRIATFPSGTLAEDQEKLWTVVKNLATDAAALLPEGMRIEFREAAAKGDAHHAMIDWCERSESKAILGQTLSSEAASTGLGSGVATLHDEIRWDLIASDARQIAGTLTQQLIGPLLQLNRGLDDPMQLPHFAFDLKETADLALYAEALPRLVNIGLPIPVAWASDKLGIPAPADAEPILQVTAPAALAPTEPLPARRESRPLVALRANPAPASDSVDPLIERLGTQADPLLDALLAPVRALLERSADLTEFRAGLLDLYPDLEAGDFAALMGQALAVADAMGRFEAAAIEPPRRESATQSRIALVAPAPSAVEIRLLERLEQELFK